MNEFKAFYSQAPLITELQLIDYFLRSLRDDNGTIQELLALEVRQKLLQLAYNVKKEFHLGIFFHIA